MTVPVATKHEKRPSAWSFLFQHVAAIFKGGHYTSNRPNGISGANHLCNGDLSTANPSRPLISQAYFAAQLCRTGAWDTMQAR